MALKTWARSGIVAGTIVAAGFAASYSWFYYKMWNRPVGQSSPWCIEITPDEARTGEWMKRHSEISGIIQWRRWSSYAGRYCEEGITSAHQIARRIATGQREEVAVIVPAKRSLAELASVIAVQLHA
jgi:hypothetical protein